MRKIYLLLIPLLALASMGIFATPTNAQATAAIESDPDIQVGVLFSVKATGLTPGQHYGLDVVHSAGNITDVATASGSVVYFEILIEDEDSDGIVILVLYQADSSGTRSGTDLTTGLVSLKTAQDYINPAFFLLILTPFLIIMVVYAIAKKFVKTG
jgi:hypothetical protein